jgi:arylsulfatase A-like enzyme
MRVLILFVAACLGAVCSMSQAADARRPNLLVIVGDDMGYADVGFHGCKDIPTPHLDALAASGVRFTNGHVSGPYCSPTRAGLLTGRYQQRFGHEFNPGGNAEGGGKAGLPVSEKTMADRLKAAGYKTGLVGKWHLGAAPQFHPQKRGFDEFFGFLGGANAYLPQRGGDSVPNILRGTKPVEETEYLTDAFGREAIAFIDRHKAEPFFLYLAFNAVHTPMHADDARLKKFAGIADERRRTYAAMMSAMDDAIGRVIEKLRADALEENTLIVFHSDNGGPTMPTTTVNGSSNAPLRGSKRQTLEGGIRVPFVMSWKGHLPAGKVYEQPVIQLDVLPTALAAAGIEAGDARLEGVNLLPHLTGEKSDAPHAELFWRFGEQMAVRRGDWKLVRYGDNTKADPNESWPKLYNLADDIGESQDLAAERPKVVKELEAAWKAWNKDNVPPLWGGGAEGRARRPRAAARGAT